MSHTNYTTIKNFIITGFPGLLPKYYGIVSAVLLIVFLTIVTVNSFILFFILYEKSIHKPTYQIFFHLAMADLLFGFVTLPKVISRYWWNDLIVSFAACFTQMYFVHSIGAINSIILLIMALDRFVAICFPFRYPVVFTNKTVSIACGLTWIITFIRMLGLTLHAISLHYCNRNIIVHCYCDSISITSLGCGVDDVRYVQVVALINAMVSLLLPLTVIIICYFSIIATVLKMSNVKGCYKALHTCTPQILITCLYYVPRCFVYLANIVGFTFSTNVRIVIIMMYSFIPPIVNPMIYCLKTNDIKKPLIKSLKNQKVSVVRCVKTTH